MHLVGFVVKKFVTMHSHMNVKLAAVFAQTYNDNCFIIHHLKKSGVTLIAEVKCYIYIYIYIYCFEKLRIVCVGWG